MLANWQRYGRGFGRLAALAWVMATAALALGLRRRHRRDLAGRARWLQQTSQRALAALGVKRLAAARPPAPALIASNHLGYLDILVLAAVTPVVFVAKREVGGWPAFGWFARMAGTRFIDREKRRDVARVAAELDAPLAAGVGVVLFLEGTSTAGGTVLPFRSSLLQPAIEYGWTVTPVALGYDVPAGHSAADEVCWWGDMKLGPHLWNLCTLPEIAVRVAWGEPVVGATDRKELADALHARVIALARSPMDSLIEAASPSLRP